MREDWEKSMLGKGKVNSKKGYGMFRKVLRGERLISRWVEFW